MNTENVKDFKGAIESIVDARIDNEGITKYIAAVVSKVNADNTVNVYLPPDTTRTISSLLNKTGQTLAVNDSVEICTKNGKTSNAWVAIKHKTNFNVDKQINDAISELNLGNVSQLSYDVVDTW